MSHDPELLASMRPPGWRNPTPARRYDLVVLGAGPAGIAAARDAVAGGASVALVDRRSIGGVSLATGSVPSKAMLRTAQLYGDVTHAERFGAPVPADIHRDFAAAMARMRRLRARIAGMHSAERMRLAGIDVFFGEARFTGPDEVALGEARLGFRHALIATGARPHAPDIPGLAQTGYLTSETIFDLDACPARLMVIGGGPLGCELAQTFCRLGAHVVIVQNAPKFLPREERDAAQLLSESLARDGVEIHLDSTVTAARPGQPGETLLDLVNGDARCTIAADAVLAGVGRTANIDGLGLDTAGVTVSAEPGIAVDDFLQTTNPLIYAAGDVCLEHRFTHAAIASARLAVRNALFGGTSRWSAVTIPWCTYTDPEIAHVGLHVAEARDRAIPIETVTTLMHDTDRAMLDGQERGFVKIHLRAGTDEILGATIVATHAGEMINEITLAIAAGIGLVALSRVVHAYPTEAAAIGAAAEAFVRSRQDGPDPARPDWPVG